MPKRQIQFGGEDWLRKASFLLQLEGCVGVTRRGEISRIFQVKEMTRAKGVR